MDPKLKGKPRRHEALHEKKNGESKHALKRKQNQTKHVLRSWWNLFLSRKTELRNYEGQT